MPAAAHLRRLRETADGPVALGELAQRLGPDGLGLLAVVLSVPFLQPIPLAGLGTPVGVVLAAAGVQLALGRERLPLPAFVARRRLSAGVVERILAAAEKILTALERFTKPRWKAAARMHRAIGAAMVLLGLNFAIPIFVPFGNPLTAASMLTLGLALLEDDGLLAILGLIGAAATTALHVAFLWLLWTGGRAMLAGAK